jgi:hypothetical protein
VEDLRSWLAATRGPAVSVVVAETAAESVPIAPHGTPGMRWTPERLADLVEYHAQYGASPDISPRGGRRPRG